MIDSSKYKNIIFDLGGVLLNIDYRILINEFAKIGIDGFENFFSQAKQKELFDKYEKGLISSQEMRNTLKQFCLPGTTDTEIDIAWNSMLLDFPKERLELLNYFK